MHMQALVTFCFCLRDFFFFFRIQRCLYFFLLRAHVGTCDVLFLSLRVGFFVEGFKDFFFLCLFSSCVYKYFWNTFKILSWLPCGKIGSRYTQATLSSRQSSATHSCQCVQHFPVSKQWYGCQRLVIFNVHTNVDAFDCTRGLHKHCKRVGSGRNIACRAGELNSCQYWAWGSVPTSSDQD